MALISKNADESLKALDAQIDQALQARLSESPDLSLDEITRVSQLDRKLLPVDVRLSEDTLENLRALAKLSNIQLKPASQITSHRKILGRFIVLAKKLTYPFIKIHLEKTIEETRDFCSWSLTLQAKQAVELERLRRARAL